MCDIKFAIKLRMIYTFSFLEDSNKISSPFHKRTLRARILIRRVHILCIVKLGNA